MVTGYRLTEEEFLLLAYKYRLAAVPVWMTCDPETIDPEKPLRTLGRKSMLLRQNETYIVHPLIDFLFSQLSQADRFAGGTDRVFCYFCPQAALVLARRCGSCRFRRRRTASRICVNAGLNEKICKFPRQKAPG